MAKFVSFHFDFTIDTTFFKRYVIYIQSEGWVKNKNSVLTLWDLRYIRETRK